MNGKNPIKVFLFAIILSISCKDSKQDIAHFEYSDFKKILELKGKLFPLEAINKPGNIKVIPQYKIVIVLETGQTEYFASVYTMDSLKLLRKFAKHGIGLNESVAANNLRYLINSKKISITDPVKQVINYYSLDSIINPKAEVNISESIDLDPVFKKSKNHIRRPLILNDKIVDIRKNHADSSIGIFNFYSLNGVFLSKGGIFPKINTDFPNRELTNIFIGGINISDDYKYLIWNYYNLDMLDLYDLNGNLVSRAYGPNGYEPEYEEIEVNDSKEYFPSKNSHFGFSGLAKMKDSSLFVLYNGLTTITGEYHCKQLFKYSDKLKPEIIYNLDMPVFDFDISWESKKIYALTHKPKSGIIIYNF